MTRGISVRNRRAQGLNRQCRGMLFSRRQTTDRFYDLLPRQLQSIFNRHSLQDLSHCGATRQGWRTTVGQESRGLDMAITNSQTETQTIAADGVRLFSDRIGVDKFACVAWLRQMTFEDF